MVCLNTNNPEVAKLMKVTKVGLLELTIRYNNWLKDNPGESRMPNPTELGIAGIKQNKSDLVKSSLVPVIIDNYGVTVSKDRYNYNNNSYSIDQILKATLGITINSSGYASVNAKVFMDNNPAFMQAAMNSNPSLSETAIMNMFSSFLAQSNSYAIAVTDVDGFVEYINDTLQRSPIIDRSYIDLEERLSGFRNRDGSNKTYSSYDEALEIADEYNSNSKELQAFVVRVFDNNDNTLYGIRLEENVARTSIQVPDWFVIDESEITYTDDDGNLCAANGLTNTVSGTQWKIVKDFKGKPKHRQGGYDITIKDNGFYVNNIKAKNGLLIENKRK